MVTMEKTSDMSKCTKKYYQDKPLMGRRYEADRMPNLKLNKIQQKAKEDVEKKCKLGIYQYTKIKCECGGQDFELISKKDRYGLPLDTVLCKQCGLMLTNPRMNQESYNNFYDEEYRRLYVGTDTPTDVFYLEQVRHGKEIFKYISSVIKKNDFPYNVLEVGCGAGGILAYFKEQGCEIQGIDLGSQYINFGITKGLRLNVGCTKDLVSSGKKYDLIILSHVLEHFLDIPSELESIKKLLSSSGILYVELPGIKYIKYSYAGDLLLFLQNAHTYHFTLNTLSQIMGWNGFELIDGDESIRGIFKQVESKRVDCICYYNEIRETILATEKNRIYYSLITKIRNRSMQIIQKIRNK